MKLIDVVNQQIKELNELKQFCEAKIIRLQEEQSKGTYAGVHFDTPTKQKIHKFMSEHDIPTSVRPDKLHSTLLYSTKHLPDYVPAGKISMTGTPKKFDVWQTQDKSSNCLVLEYDCPELVARHHELMKEHDATYNHPTYKTHVTLSYDIGDKDVSKLDPKEIGSLHIVEEYYEPLDTSWAKNKGTKKGG